MSKWIRSGDLVTVIAGNDKGKQGRVLTRSKQRILVEGINIRKRHVKPRGENEPGKIVKSERSIHISNVKLAHEKEKNAKFKLQVNSKKEKEIISIVGGKESVHRNLKKSNKGKK